MSLSRTGHLLVTVAALGCRRPFPGTWGSLPPPALAFALALAGLAPGAGVLESWVYNATFIALAIVFTLICVRFGEEAEARWRAKDPSNVVADETAGQSLALLFPPAIAGSASLAFWHVLIAFIAFRAFDIVKPWPAHQLQRIPSGWGIVIDDLVAGLQALIVTQLVVRTLIA